VPVSRLDQDQPLPDPGVEAGGTVGGGAVGDGAVGVPAPAESPSRSNQLGVDASDPASGLAAGASDGTGVGIVGGAAHACGGAAVTGAGSCHADGARTLAPLAVR
jgi:hypothetical protein